MDDYPYKDPMYGCIDVWPNLSGKACVQLLEKIATQDMEDGSANGLT